MPVTRILLAFLGVLIAWDLVTTYYGSLSAFVGFNTNVATNLLKATIAQQFVSLLFAGALMAAIVSYRAILNARNWVTSFIMYVAFIVDFLTSLYGTASATITLGGGILGFQWLIVIFLSAITTLSPIVIYQVYEATGE